MEVVGFFYGKKRCTKKSERKLKGIFTVYFRLEGSIVHVNFAKFINIVNIIFYGA